uniref:HnRNP M nuclear localisation signal domain-containing protein n=1 Tax=Salvator merianae TaxID=96440 RepID=A0A8D0E2A7_SALMN
MAAVVGAAAAVAAAAASESGVKMAEAGPAVGGGGMLAVAANGAGDGDGVPKSEGERSNQNEKRKEKNAKRGGGRFEPYTTPSKRYRAFITNIPFDVKWQYLKDLVKEKGKGCWVLCLPPSALPPTPPPHPKIFSAGTCLVLGL